MSARSTALQDARPWSRITRTPPAISSRSLPPHLHGLDLEVYLRDFFRVLPHWPSDRYLELAPSTGPAPAPRSIPPSSLASSARSPSRRPSTPRRPSSSRRRADRLHVVLVMSPL